MVVKLAGNTRTCQIEVVLGPTNRAYASIPNNYNISSQVVVSRIVVVLVIIIFQRYIYIKMNSTISFSLSFDLVDFYDPPYIGYESICIE